MGQHDQLPNVVNIHLSRVEGVVYANSPQLRGLHVCGKTEDEVIADLPAIVADLIKLNYGKVVQIVEAPALKPQKEQTRPLGWANFLAFPQLAAICL